VDLKQWQTYSAELLGTFVLVFGGTTAIVGAIRMDAPVLVVIPFAFGLSLLAGLYAFAEVSGGHFNPAVSLALFLDGRLNTIDLLGYWVAQFVGAILASLLLLLATSKADVAATATTPSSNGTAFVMEVAFTAIFVVVILQATRSDVYGGTALVAIPLALAVTQFAAIPFSGASVNPARTFGPAVVGDVWTGIWIYFLGPAVGGTIAWLVHTVVVRGDTNLRDDVQRIENDVEVTTAETTLE
jgi:aquaporin Z